MQRINASLRNHFRSLLWQITSSYPITYYRVGSNLVNLIGYCRLVQRDAEKNDSSKNNLTSSDIVFKFSFSMRFTLELLNSSYILPTHLRISLFDDIFTFSSLFVLGSGFGGRVARTNLLQIFWTQKIQHTANMESNWSQPRTSSTQTAEDPDPIWETNLTSSTALTSTFNYQLADGFASWGTTVE